MIRIVRTKTLRANGELRVELQIENDKLQRELASLRARFAADILYGKTAPKNPVDAANKAMENMSHD